MQTVSNSLVNIAQIERVAYGEREGKDDEIHSLFELIVKQYTCKLISNLTIADR